MYWTCLLYTSLVGSLIGDLAADGAFTPVVVSVVLPVAPSLVDLVDLPGLLLTADGALTSLFAFLGAGGFLGDLPLAPEDVYKRQQELLHWRGKMSNST